MEGILTPQRTKTASALSGKNVLLKRLSLGISENGRRETCLSRTYVRQIARNGAKSSSWAYVINIGAAGFEGNGRRAAALSAGMLPASGAWRREEEKRR
jgi:hypothetical protein